MGEGTTRRGTATPVHRPQRPADSTHSSTRGLRPPEQLESAQLCLTLCYPLDCSLPGSFVHGDSPGKNERMAGHSRLQGIFPTQGSNPGLPHCRQILYSLSHQNVFGGKKIQAWKLEPCYLSHRGHENVSHGEFMSLNLYFFVITSRAAGLFPEARLCLRVRERLRVPLRNQGYCGFGRGLSGLLWVCPPARGPGTLIPSAQRLVWAAKQPLGKAALGALFA